MIGHLMTPARCGKTTHAVYLEICYHITIQKITNAIMTRTLFQNETLRDLQSSTSCLKYSSVQSLDCTY